MKKRMISLGLALAFVPFLALAENVAAGSSSAPGCSGAGGIVPVCGFHAPEDFELLPGGKQLLISQVHRSAAGPDAEKVEPLLVMDLATEKLRPVPVRNEFTPGWGAATCDQPTSHLGPHGIHLSRRANGAMQLMVVNHQERESIEMFELVREHGNYVAVWRGCVVNPGGGMFNDVSATGDGGFVATIMLERSLIAQKDGMEVALSGADTGYLVEWQPNGSVERMPNSEAPFNNGVQVSADGRYVYFAAWTAKQLRKYDRRAQKVVQTVVLPFHPDNISIRADGTLIVVGIDELETFKSCTTKHQAFCNTAWSVAAVSPATFDAVPLFHAKPGVQAGASTAVQIGSTLYVGSYMGDRLTKVKLDKVH